ncbi:MAG: hypothetical protein FJW35_01125 [Acidobacteria bacterium]|nr:hypothetical protein [Acidobacteriota bacterium]
MGFALVFWAAAAGAQDGRNVLLLVDEASPVSVEAEQNYAERRALPADNILRTRGRNSALTKCYLRW